jgi:hypothetical protein
MADSCLEIIGATTRLDFHVGLEDNEVGSLLGSSALSSLKSARAKLAKTAPL